jgi:hypothetical protein
MNPQNEPQPVDFIDYAIREVQQRSDQLAGEVRELVLTLLNAVRHLAFNYANTQQAQQAQLGIQPGGTPHVGAAQPPAGFGLGPQQVQQPGQPQPQQAPQFAQQPQPVQGGFQNQGQQGAIPAGIL